MHEYFWHMLPSGSRWGDINLHSYPQHVRVRFPREAGPFILISEGETKAQRDSTLELCDSRT